MYQTPGGLPPSSRDTRNKDWRPGIDQREHYEERERGGCLSFLLGVLFVLHFFGICYSIGQSTELNREFGDMGESAITLFICLSVGANIAIVVAIAAFWNWKRWGYQLLLGLYGFNALLNFCSGSIGQSIVNVILIGLLLFLTTDIEHMLE